MDQATLRPEAPNKLRPQPDRVAGPTYQPDRSSIWRQVPSRVTGTVLHPGDWINQAEVEQVAQPQVQFADDLIDYQLEFLDEVVATLIDRWLDSVLVGESI